MTQTLSRFTRDFNRIFFPEDNFISDDVPPIQVELSGEQSRQDPARWMNEYKVLRERGIAPRTLEECEL